MALHVVDLAGLALANRGLTDPAWARPGSRDVVAVEATGEALDEPVTLPVVVVALADVAVDPPAWSDLALPAGSALVDAAVATVEHHPLACASLVTLLRGAEGRDLHAGLVAESATYSALQAGPEFARWRAGRIPRRRPPGGPAISVGRDGNEVTVTLRRPGVRNAVNTEMRDALVEAFTTVRHDASITSVHLRGAGPDFCAGGDLDEFGAFPDPATAHVLRLRQSPGRAIAAVADRVVAHLHGACMGSGIELPAFAATVEADHDVRIGLPELSLGLIPGAGGTVSLPQRIGRQWTARLALTGEVLDAQGALAVGLVDRLVS